MTQSIWLPLRSLSDQVTIAKHHYYCQPNLELGRSEHGLPPQSNDMNSLSLSFSLSLSLSVCLYCPEKFCVQGLALSVCMYVMVFQDQHTLTK